MRFGLGVLGLPPAAFWSMTLRELACAVRPASPDPAHGLGRPALGELMRRFPDRVDETDG